MKRHPFRTVMVLLALVGLGAVVLPKLHSEQRSDWWKNSGDDAVRTQAQETVLAFAADNGLRPDQYPNSLLELLERNPETEQFVLEYPLEYGKDHAVDLSEYANTEAVPLLMQWDQRWGYIDYGEDVAGLTGCGPVCLSMAALYVTGDPQMDPAYMLQFALKNGYCVAGAGSSWTLISEGGEKLGLDVTEIPLDKERIFRNLEVDNPIICVMGPGDFTTSGHFIVMTGCQDGMIRINDPNSYERSSRLWNYEDIQDQIRNLWVIRES